MTDRSPVRPPFVVVRGDGTRPMPADEPLKGAVAAIGNFEGVHRGHRAVIGMALERARGLGRKAAVLTFEPHPRAVFNPGEPVFRLTDEAAKLRLLAGTGLDGAIVMRFDAALASLPAEDFVQRILVDRFALAGVVVGFDFHFGQGRSGSPAFLQAAGRRHGFTVDIVPPFSDGGVRIVRVGVGGRRFDGVASFGRRPTFDNGAVLLEPFLFDFAGDLYGQTLDVAFIQWIRPELAFASVADLVRRIEEDCALARAALAKAPDAYPPI